MTSANPRRVGVLVLAGVFVATGASAQPGVRSFDELQRTLQVGQTVFVTETSGRQTKGKIAEVSASSFVLLTPQTRTFSEDAVTEIRRGDPLGNGALIGAGIGMGLAMRDYLIDPSEPGNAAIFTVAIGLGIAIGAGIDALVKEVLYVSPQRRLSVTVSPLLANDRRGVQLSMRF